MPRGFPCHSRAGASKVVLLSMDRMRGLYTAGDRRLLLTTEIFCGLREARRLHPGLMSGSRPTQRLARLPRGLRVVTKKPRKPLTLRGFSEYCGSCRNNFWCQGRNGKIPAIALLERVRGILPVRIPPKIPPGVGTRSFTCFWLAILSFAYVSCRDSA